MPSRRPKTVTVREGEAVVIGDVTIIIETLARDRSRRATLSVDAPGECPVKVIRRKRPTIADTKSDQA